MLQTNALGSFDSYTPGLFYRLYNDNHQDSLLLEFQGGLEASKANLESIDELPDQYKFEDIPSTACHRNVPKLPGQDTRQFDGWNFHKQQYRQTLHVQCDRSKGKFVHLL